MLSVPDMAVIWSRQRQLTLADLAMKNVAYIIHDRPEYQNTWIIETVKLRDPEIFLNQLEELLGPPGDTGLWHLIADRGVWKQISLHDESAFVLMELTYN